MQEATQGLLMKLKTIRTSNFAFGSHLHFVNFIYYRSTYGITRLRAMYVCLSSKLLSHFIMYDKLVGEELLVVGKKAYYYKPKTLYSMAALANLA